MDGNLSGSTIRTRMQGIILKKKMQRLDKRVKQFSGQRKTRSPYGPAPENSIYKRKDI